MTIEHEFILGGQKSGKSRRAEQRAAEWLAAAPGTHRAVLIATAQAHDDEMQERIVRHQADRADRVPGMRTIEEPVELARAIVTQSACRAGGPSRSRSNSRAPSSRRARPRRWW